MFNLISKFSYKPSFSLNTFNLSNVSNFNVTKFTSNWKFASQNRFFSDSHDKHDSHGVQKYNYEVPSFEAYKRDKASTDVTRQAFSYFVIGTGSMTLATGVKNIVVDLLATMTPAADVLAMANIEVDIGGIPVGQAITVKWRGKPVFVRHRTQAEIDSAVADDNEALRDQEKDEVRRLKPEYMILLGVCTHLGCVPLNNAGEYRGWFCPCHGSHYDTSGRIRKGPAPKNLEVPPYKFLDETKVLVGEK